MIYGSGNVMDDIDIRILKYIMSEEDKYVGVTKLINNCSINQDKLIERLLVLDNSGYIFVTGKGGVNVPGLTLPNGIHHIQISARGKSLLRNSVT